MLRIMVVDDHEVVRFGLKGLLERQSGWEVVAEAGTVSEAIAKAREYQPNVIIMDIRLKEGNGIDACREIKKTHPDIQVIMLTSFAEDDFIFNAISAGAAGYVLKQVGNDDLIQAIQTVARGEALLDPTVTNRVLAKIRASARSEAFADLTEQELQVLALVAQGKTNKEVAQALHLSDGTIRNYVSNMLGKLGLSNRAEATAYAVRHNLDDYLGTKIK
ncbi:MAG: response regulator transcription factor [Chloroflexota bacterium]